MHLINVLPNIKIWRERFELVTNNLELNKEGWGLDVWVLSYWKVALQVVFYIYMHYIVQCLVGNVLLLQDKSGCMQLWLVYVSNLIPLLVVQQVISYENTCCYIIRKSFHYLIELAYHRSGEFQSRTGLIRNSSHLSVRICCARKVSTNKFDKHDLFYS